MTGVCLGSMVSDGCKSGGLEFKTDLGGQLFSACQLISCICVLSLLYLLA